jgi:uroporphyrinogen decarboxylase
MTSHERVQCVMKGEIPDRVPFDTPFFFPEFRERWAAFAGRPGETLEDYYGLDVWEVEADHSPRPSMARVLSEDSDSRVLVDGFGEVRRERKESLGVWQVLDVAIKEKSDLDRFTFEPASDDARYERMAAEYERRKDRYWVRAKVGGPYSRSKRLRGEVPFLMDLATDEAFAVELVNRVTGLMIAVGVESIRRLKLTTAIHIHDDFASLRGLMFSPRVYERVFLPAMARMCEAFHGEGVRVIYGGEGRTMDVLPGLAAAGVDAFCCLEARAGMDAVELRRRLGDKVVFFGSMCNTVVLPKGTKEEIRAMVLRHMRLAHEGRSIAGPSHSVSDEVAPENLDYLWRLVQQWAPWDARLPKV